MVPWNQGINFIILFNQRYTEGGELLEMFFFTKDIFTRDEVLEMFSQMKCKFKRGELLEMFFPNQRWIQKRGTSWNVFPYQRPKINSEDRTLVAQFVNDCGLIEMSNRWY